MKATVYLRIASILTFLHAILHSAGIFTGHPTAGAQQAAALAMKANQFHMMGVTRTYWDFQLGFALAVAVFLFVEAAIFWRLGDLARTIAPLLRSLFGTFFVGYVALAIISWRFFFPLPAIFELLIAACLALAMIKSRHPAAA